MVGERERPPMIELVSPAWLAERLQEVRIVDVREPWEYSGIGHVPGAVNIPFDAFRSPDDEDAGMLPGAEAFAALLSEAGIAPGDPIVAYDDTHGVFAARFLVTALCYGHRPLYLLDGDYSAWNREHPTSTEEPTVEPTDYAVDPDAQTPLIGFEDVEAAIDTDAVLVDTRRPDEYEEGHIPGAVQLDWKELVDDDDRGLKPESERRSILEGRGIAPDRRIVLYCNTARRISHTYAVLVDLGYERVDFYEGSLTEWEAAGGPIETGD